eukprot:324126_1
MSRKHFSLSFRMSTYTWKIPHTNAHRKDLLTHGYIRQNTSKYIYEPIIHLFAAFYGPESFTLPDIQHATNLQLFVSPIFTYNGFKWYLELHPNGSNIENEGSVILYLCLVMIPTHIRKLCISFQLSLAETNTVFRSIKSFSPTKWYNCWSRDTLRFADIQHLDQLTFSVHMSLLTITQPTVDDGDSTTERTTICDITKSKQTTETLSTISRPLATYKWWVTDAKTVHRIRTCDMSEHFNGPMMCFFPFKWSLQFIPKQPKMRSPWIGLRIWYCPPTVKRCLCKINIMFHELSVAKSTYKVFEHNSLLSVWAVTFTDKEYRMYNALQSYSFTVDVSIIDIVYKEPQVAVGLHPTKFVPLMPDDLAIFEYEWKIEGAELHAMQRASNVFSFTSCIFEAYSLKWYLSVWPNGSRESRKDSMNIFLLLVSFRDISLKVPIKFDLEWCQSGKTCTEYQIFDVNQCCGGETIWPLKHEDIAQLKAITLKLTVSIVDIMVGNELITNEYMKQHDHASVIQAREICVPCEVFLWRFPPQSVEDMKDSAPGMMHKSDVFEMYNMEWYLTFYPNGSKQENIKHTVVNIHLVELPTEDAIVSVRYTIFVEESDTRYGGEATFRHEHMMSSWDTERISTDRFRELTTFTIRLDLELIDVFQKDVVPLGSLKTQGSVVDMSMDGPCAGKEKEKGVMTGAVIVTEEYTQDHKTTTTSEKSEHQTDDKYQETVLDEAED